MKNYPAQYIQRTSTTRRTIFTEPRLPDALYSRNLDYPAQYIHGTSTTRRIIFTEPRLPDALYSRNLNYPSQCTLYNLYRTIDNLFITGQKQICVLQCNCRDTINIVIVQQIAIQNLG